MRGLDTNILVRHLIEDTPDQVSEVDRLLDESRQRGERLFIPVLVLCELTWVLRSAYRRKKPEILAILHGLLDVDLFEVERAPLVRRCLLLYRHGRADFSDYLIGEICREAECRDTVTFDAKLAGAAGFTLLR